MITVICLISPKRLDALLDAALASWQSISVW